MEKTVIGIKPDAFSPESQREKGSELRITLPKNVESFVDEVKRGLLNTGLRIVSEHKKVCTEELARKHYAEFADVFTEEFGENKQDFLAKFMSSGESYWFLCEGENAVKKGREVIWGIREKYLVTPNVARYNMTHGSGNIEEAKMEEELHFGN